MEKVKEQSSQILLTAMALAIVLTLGLFVLFEWTRPRTGTIIIPAGNTYLGPSTTK